MIFVSSADIFRNKLDYADLPNINYVGRRHFVVLIV